MSFIGEFHALTTNEYKYLHRANIIVQLAKEQIAATELIEMALSYDHLLKVQPEDFVVRLFKKERILTFKNVMRGATVASGLLIYNYYRIYSR